MGQKVAQPAGKETAKTVQPQQTAVAEGQKPKLQGREAALLNLQRTHGNRHVKQMLKGGILHRQCSACGQAIAGGECTSCAKKGSLQRKLTIGDSNDPLEQEADRVADQVMVASAHSIVGSTPPRIQRFTGQSTGQADMAAPASVDRVLSSPGRPLEPGLQQDMEQRFGHDFSRVRVHTDAAAEQSALDVNANAYTVGRDIVFGVNQFAPRTNAGQRLIAHELTHVVQQYGRSGGLIQRDSTQKGEQEQDEVISNTVLAKAFQAADSKQWEVAARLANGLREFDMRIFLSQYKDPELIYYLHIGALNASGVGDKSAIALATEAKYEEIKQEKDLRYQRELAKQNGTAAPSKDGALAGNAPSKVAVQSPEPTQDQADSNVRLRQLNCVVKQGGCSTGTYSRDAGTAEEHIPEYNKNCREGKEGAEKTGYPEDAPDLCPSPDECNKPPYTQQELENFHLGLGIAAVVVGGAIAVGATIVLAPEVAVLLGVVGAAARGARVLATVISIVRVTALAAPLAAPLEVGTPIALVALETAGAAGAAGVGAAGATGVAGAMATVGIPTATTAAASTSVATVVKVTIAVLSSTIAATTLSSDSPQTSEPKQDDDPKECPPIILYLPSAKAQDLDAYAALIGQLEHVPDRARNTKQRNFWRGVMPGRIPPAVWNRANSLGLSRDDVIFPYWSLTTKYEKNKPMEVDHLIEMQVTPIGRESQFDTMFYYRLMDASSNGGAGAELMHNILKMREALAACYKDQGWMYRPIKFERVIASPSNNPGIWTQEDLIAGRHLDAYEKLP